MAAALTAAAGAEPAAAVEPQVIGQVGGAGAVGPCTCSLFQRATGGAPGYAFPFSGILTKVGVFVGGETQSGDSFQARTFSVLDPSNASVIDGGEAHSLSGLPLNSPSTFVDRIPAASGDLLGVHFAVNPLITETPRYFTTAAEADVMDSGKVKLDPAIGESFMTEDTKKARVNVEAVLEPDEDGDGYGDASQDLCLGSPTATAACSGTLFGSNLQGQRSTSPVSGGLRVQTTIGGASTAAPSDGVVVRWRVLDAESGSYRIRVVALKELAGPFTKFTVLHSGAVQSVTAPAQPVVSKISTFQTRIPIPAGAYVGLSGTLRAGFQASGGAATYVDGEDGGDGITVLGTNHNGTILYDADIEPDADHDGYGDLTQDQCPTDGSTQAACPPAPPKSQSTPAVSGFKAVPAKFRVKKGGAVVSARRAHRGTTLKLTLTEAASVAFKVERRARCSRPSGKGGKCARWVLVHAFKRDLSQGSSSIPYSGRYRKGHKVLALEPGSYRIVALPTNGAGRTGTAVQAPFTVVP